MTSREIMQIISWELTGISREGDAKSRGLEFARFPLWFRPSFQIIVKIENMSEKGHEELREINWTHD